MRQVELRLIEKAVAEATAQNDAEDAVKSRFSRSSPEIPRHGFELPAPAEAQKQKKPARYMRPYQRTASGPRLKATGSN